MSAQALVAQIQSDAEECPDDLAAVVISRASALTALPGTQTAAIDTAGIDTAGTDTAAIDTAGGRYRRDRDPGTGRGSPRRSDPRVPADRRRPQRGGRARRLAVQASAITAAPIANASTGISVARTGPVAVATGGGTGSGCPAAAAIR